MNRTEQDIVYELDVLLKSTESLCFARLNYYLLLRDLRKKKNGKQHSSSQLQSGQ